MDFDDRSGRDSRLLALVIAIALAVLVVLARFRFPQDESHPAPVTPGPLERLAARATFEDLAAAVHTTLQRVEPALLNLPLEAIAQNGKASASAAGRIALGVRIKDEWAVVHVPAGFRIARTGTANTLVVREPDAAKELAIVSRPLDASEDRLPSGFGELAGFMYLCVVEPTPDGPTASPMFLGRLRTVLDDRWPGPVAAPAGASALPAGSLLFQIDGRFVGMALPHQAGGTVIIPAAQLESLVASSREKPGGGLP